MGHNPNADAHERAWLSRLQTEAFARETASRRPTPSSDTWKRSKWERQGSCCHQVARQCHTLQALVGGKAGFNVCRLMGHGTASRLGFSSRPNLHLFRYLVNAAPSKLRLKMSLKLMSAGFRAHDTFQAPVESRSRLDVFRLLSNGEPSKHWSKMLPVFNVCQL